MVAVLVGVTLTVGEEVKVGVVVFVGVNAFVFVGMVVLEGTIIVGEITVSVSKSITCGSSTAQPAMIIKLRTNTL